MHVGDDVEWIETSYVKIGANCSRGGFRVVFMLEVKVEFGELEELEEDIVKER